MPEKNLISPPTNQFTHELARAQPYYYTAAHQGTSPDGVLQAGTKVVLLVYDGGKQCRGVGLPAVRQEEGEGPGEGPPLT